LNQPQQHSSSIIAGNQTPFGCGLDLNHTPNSPHWRNNGRGKKARSWQQGS
jgi:hypothetical protein